jgi:hypothetical protein
MNRVPNEFATGFLRTAGCFTFFCVLIVAAIFLIVAIPRFIDYLEHNDRPSHDPPVRQLGPHERPEWGMPEPDPLPKPAEPKSKLKVRPPVSKPGRPPIVISPRKPDEKESLP